MLPPAPRPGSRPVADAPLEFLLGQIDALAKRWAMALIADLPLPLIGELPLEDLARESPALLELAIKALASDSELERLRQAPAPRLLANAGDRAFVVRALEALRSVLWEALTQASLPPDPRQLVDLADRLAGACAVIAAGALATPAAPPEPEPASGPLKDPVEDERGEAAVHALHGFERLHRAGAPSASHGSSPAAAPEDLARPAPRIALLDEIADLGTPAPPSAGDAAARRGWTGRSALPPERRMPPELLWSAPDEAAEGQAIEARDLRRREGPAAWVRSIGRRLERYARDGRPFTVLLLHVSARSRESEPGRAPDVPGVALARVEHALAEEISVAGALTCEAPGRYWVVTHRGGHGFATALAERLDRVVKVSSAEEGSIFEAAIGVAICPDDGRDAAALAAHADVEALADRAARKAAAEAAEKHFEGPVIVAEPAGEEASERGGEHSAAPRGGSAA